MPLKILVMGVSGSGKSTIGAALAARMNAAFIDADDLHPADNVAHMAAGLPLTDRMRWPWLDACGAAMIATDGDVVLGCSALKRSYRDRLRAAVPDLRLVYPEAPQALIETRMAARKGHFMPTALLNSQFATLEPPSPDEAAINIDISTTIPKIVDAIMSQL